MSRRKSSNRFLLKKRDRAIGEIKLIRSRIEETGIKSAKGDQIGHDPLSRIPSLDPVPPVRTWVHELPATSGDANDFQKL
tara:strand:- start:233 stop:472 length:240 start_codon:yes stop_codon:yes gene_type:complete